MRTYKKAVMEKPHRIEVDVCRLFINDRCILGQTPESKYVLYERDRDYWSMWEPYDKQMRNYMEGFGLADNVIYYDGDLYADEPITVVEYPNTFCVMGYSRRGVPNDRLRATWTRDMFHRTYEGITELVEFLSSAFDPGFHDRAFQRCEVLMQYFDRECGVLD